MSKEEVFSMEEIHEMFNTSFLKNIQKFGKRVQENNPEMEIALFNVRLLFNFPPQDDELSYEHIDKNITFQLQPITKDDLIKWEKEQMQRENPENKTEEFQQV